MKRIASSAPDQPSSRMSSASRSDVPTRLSVSVPNAHGRPIPFFELLLSGAITNGSALVPC
ncbi:MAG: hypothetical protein Q7T95_02405 [Hydrogenophaga sp.]|nr:hypothetical protein [Hydrogenophaga sp.]